MVTDLDEHLGARALRALEAELQYRETRLRDAGASDLKEYLRAGHPEPLPRLVVIIDEFATMAAELPDFIDSLVGIAQRGRSLGVHMILATQRPGGAVNDNIRANTNLRISLRVQEAAESADIVGSPLAASIGRKQAGRGYVRLGAAEVFPFQAALVTGVTKKEEQAPVKVARFVFGPDPIVADESPAASPAAPAAPVAGEPEQPSDLEVLVAAAAEAAQLAGLAKARRPWPETLPEQVTLDELADPATVDAAGAVVGAGAPFGLADDPDKQRRALFSWAPPAGNFYVCGMAGPAPPKRSRPWPSPWPAPTGPTASGSTGSTSAPRPWPAWPACRTAAGSSARPTGSGSSASCGSWPTNSSGAAATLPPRVPCGSTRPTRRRRSRRSSC